MDLAAGTIHDMQSRRKSLELLLELIGQSKRKILELLLELIGRNL